MKKVIKERHCLLTIVILFSFVVGLKAQGLTATGTSQALFANHALEFNGTNSEVVVSPGTAFSSETSLTIEAWVKLDELTQLPSIAGDEFWGADIRGVLLRIDNYTQNSVPQMVVGTTTGWYTANASPGSIPLGEWTHVAGTITGSLLKIFINGSEAGSRHFAGLIRPSTSDFRVGGHWDTGLNRQWKGVIDEVRIWKTARSENDISNSMSTSLTGSESDLLAYWKMDEGTGTTITDITGNGYDGTINNAVWTAGYSMNPPTGIYDYSAKPVGQLITNYPNPFNPSTNIVFTTSEISNVKIEVFDLTGRKIETVVNELLHPGLHTIEYTARGVPSGTYIYRIESGRFIMQKKMLLMK